MGWDTAYDRALSQPLIWGWGAHTPMELYNLYHLLLDVHLNNGITSPLWLLKSHDMYFSILPRKIEVLALLLSHNNLLLQSDLSCFPAFLIHSEFRLNLQRLLSSYLY